jgi:flagellar assembly factor FliW
LKLETLTFGTLEFDEKSIIHLPEGMLGFPKQKKYILVDEPEIQPFKWLQSLEDQYVAFPVVDPHLLFKGYTCALTLEDLRALEIEAEKDIFTLAVAVIAENPADSSINLRAPLLINHQRMVGKQVILTDASYSTMQPLTEFTQS